MENSIKAIEERVKASFKRLGFNLIALKTSYSGNELANIRVTFPTELEATQATVLFKAPAWHWVEVIKDGENYTVEACVFNATMQGQSSKAS